MKSNIKFIILILITILLISCSRTAPSTESDDGLSIYGTTGVLSVGVLSGDLTYISDMSCLLGGSSAGIDITDVSRLFEGAEETAWNGTKCDYEVAIVVSTEEYNKFARLHNDGYEAKAEYAFAYSYLTGELFGFIGGKSYLIKNRDAVKEMISERFPKGYTVSWYSSSAPDVTLGEQQCYSLGFEFRYDRFFTDKKYPGDYVMPESYHADSFEDMISNAAAAIGVDRFRAIVAVDRISGAYRVEYYPYTEPGKRIHVHDYACLYFDSDFNFLTGGVWDQ